jgi:hypothetical protein
MSLTKLTANLSNHQSLPDEPDNAVYTPEDLKLLFDKAPNDIKDYINNVLTEELPTMFVYRDEVNTLILGQVPTNSITDDKLSGAVGQIKDRLDKAITDNSRQTTAKGITGAINELYADNNRETSSKTITGAINELHTDNARLTASKTITGAINEVFTNANNLKTNVSNVVGNPLLPTDTADQIKNKIQSIKDTLATNLTAKGVSASSSETLTSLVDKVSVVTTLPSPTVGESMVAIASGEEFASNGADNWLMYKEIRINKAGTYRVKFNLYSFGNSGYGRIYKNGVPIGIQRYQTTSPATIYSEDFTFAANDLVQLYLASDTSIYTNFLSININMSSANYGTVTNS